MPAGCGLKASNARVPADLCIAYIGAGSDICAVTHTCVSKHCPVANVIFSFKDRSLVKVHALAYDAVALSLNTYLHKREDQVPV